MPGIGHTDALGEFPLGGIVHTPLWAGVIEIGGVFGEIPNTVMSFSLINDPGAVSCGVIPLPGHSSNPPIRSCGVIPLPCAGNTPVVGYAGTIETGP